PAEGGPAEQAARFGILVLIAVLNAGVCGWYCLRFIGVMYLRAPLAPLARAGVSPRLVAVWACALVTLLFGVYPEPLKGRARQAVDNRVEVPPAARAQGDAGEGR